MYISTEDINELKQKIDFLSILKKYTYLNKFNDYLYVGFNPFDKKDKSIITTSFSKDFLD